MIHSHFELIAMRKGTAMENAKDRIGSIALPIINVDMKHDEFAIMVSILKRECESYLNEIEIINNGGY